MAVLAPAYAPRRPTDTVLYGLVRQHLESFLAYAREHYDRGLPPYVENELRAYLKCGVFSEGFIRARCDACGHDLLVAFSCKSRTVCPSCTGRRMANTASAIVDRVLPDVPVRQYVLTLPYELRKLAAFKAQVLTAIGRIAVDAIFARYRAHAKRLGVEDGQCGAINFVQRFGSLNLHVHFHIALLDGVFIRDPDAGVVFHSAAPPTRRSSTRSCGACSVVQPHGCADTATSTSDRLMSARTNFRSRPPSMRAPPSPWDVVRWRRCRMPRRPRTITSKQHLASRHSPSSTTGVRWALGAVPGSHRVGFRAPPSEPGVLLSLSTGLSIDGIANFGGVC